MKKSLFVPSVLFVMMLILSACGGAGTSATIDVFFAEFTFRPSEFTVPEGRRLRSQPSITELWSMSSLSLNWARMQGIILVTSISPIFTGKWKCNPLEAQPQHLLLQVNPANIM